MEDYYQILEVSPQATFADIKSAYRLLCKEYHPDKLPPGTPEKARSYIEERFKQINQAYSVLSNESERQKYDAQYFSQQRKPQASAPVDPPPSQPQKQSQANNQDVFNAEKLQQVAHRLDAHKRQIEMEYKAIERDIDRHVKQKLVSLGYDKEIGHEQEYLKGETRFKKLGIFLLAMFNTVAGIGFMSIANGHIIFALIGGAWAGYWLLHGILVMFVYSTLNQKIAQQVRVIREQANLAKLNAKKNRDHKLSDFYQAQRQRIDFFKYIPIVTISPDYIAGLSDEDQFYLLQAISERKDRDQFNHKIQKTLAVIAQLGILAILFGLGSDRF